MAETLDDYDDLTSSGRCLAVFVSNTCNACKYLHGSYEELSSGAESNIVVVNVDINKETSTHNNVTSLPLFIIHDNGKELRRYSGNIGIDALASLTRRVHNEHNNTD